MSRTPEDLIAIGKAYACLDLIRSLSKISPDIRRVLNQQESNSVERIGEIANRLIGRLMDKYDE